MKAVRDYDLEAMVRCPAQFARQRSLRTPRDPTWPYGLFAALLVQGIREMRLRWGTALWPATWTECQDRMTEWWDRSWTSERRLEPLYRDRAFIAYERVYTELCTQGIPPGTQFDVACTITIDGHAVSVQISTIEEINGTMRLTWEKATKGGKDQSSVRAALYAAAARELDSSSLVPIQIRYLATGQLETLAKADDALSTHHDRLCTALRRLAEGNFAPDPVDGDQCPRCPYVVICPR